MGQRCSNNYTFERNVFTVCRIKTSFTKALAFFFYCTQQISVSAQVQVINKEKTWLSDNLQVSRLLKQLQCSKQTSNQTFVALNAKTMKQCLAVSVSYIVSRTQTVIGSVYPRKLQTQTPLDIRPREYSLSIMWHSFN